MFYSLKFYLKEKLKKFETNPNFFNFQVKKILSKILDPKIIQGIKNVRYTPQNLTLFLKVSNPIFAQEIKLQEEKIRKKINQSLGREVIKKIIIKLD